MKKIKQTNIKLKKYAFIDTPREKSVKLKKFVFIDEPVITSFPRDAFEQIFGTILRKTRVEIFMMMMEMIYMMI